MTIGESYQGLKIIHNTFRIPYVKLINHYIFTRDKPINLKIGEKTLKVRYGIPSLARLIKANWEVITNNETIVTLKSPCGVVISCRTTKALDFSQLQEIFLDNTYQYDVAGKNVIDIGMSIGDSAIYFAKKGAKRVIGLEPDKESFDLAVKNIEDSKVTDIVTPLNKAINTRNEDISLKVWDRFPGSNSLVEYNTKPRNSEFRIITVNGIKLEDVIDMFEERQIGLLKIDCEGCEYNILNAVSKEYLSRVQAVFMEFHNGIQNLRELLETNGFDVDIIWHRNGIAGYVKAIRK